MPDLVPVDHNPFGVNLVPVDHDPFQADPYTAAQPPANYKDPYGGAVTALGQGMLHHFMTPGETARSVTLQTPGVMTEEDAYRLNQIENEARKFGPAQALNMIGSGIPMAERMALGAGGGGIKAYHGSPHDFEKFDIGKVGAGEGAQAYGHGLYFAENPATAKAYRDTLSPLVNPLPAEQQVADDAIKRFGGRQEAIRALDDIIKKREAGERPSSGTYFPYHDEASLARDLLKSDWQPSQAGRMYEVFINADPEHFLDWDKPLSEQHPKVHEGLKRAFPAYDIMPGDINDWHNELRAFGPTSAQEMAQAGIPGIKYLDQGSRGATGNPTHNYVVFHHDIIDILKKYGLAGLVAGGAAHFKTTPVDHDPFAQ